MGSFVVEYRFFHSPHHHCSSAFSFQTSVVVVVAAELASSGVDSSSLFA